MFRLDSLKPLSRKRKRVGRGGSRGGTSGRGHKGQKARTSGLVPPGFEGGQMPLHRRLPKRGFTNARFAEHVVIVDLGRVNDMFDDGAEVTCESLLEKNVVKCRKSGPPSKFKLLAGQVTKKLTITVHQCSASAAKAVEAAGGKVVLLGE